MTKFEQLVFESWTRLSGALDLLDRPTLTEGERDVIAACLVVAVRLETIRDQLNYGVTANVPDDATPRRW